MTNESPRGLTISVAKKCFDSQFEHQKTRIAFLTDVFARWGGGGQPLSAKKCMFFLKKWKCLECSEIEEYANLFFFWIIEKEKKRDTLKSIAH